MNDPESHGRLVERNGVIRRRLRIEEKLLLALLPTLVILVVLLFVEMLAEQPLLVASLASSAFLIYLDPEHGANQVRTLLISQIMAAAVGWLAHAVFGTGYLSAGIAMIVAIILMILLDVVHPPAVSTALGFSFRNGDVESFELFVMAVCITGVLVAMQQASVRMSRRIRARKQGAEVRTRT